MEERVSPYPESTAERFLSADELERFRLEVVWPAFDYLTDGSFFGESEVGDVWIRRKKFQGPLGAKRVHLAATCREPELDEDLPDDETVVYGVSVRTEEERATMTQSLVDMVITEEIEDDEIEEALEDDSQEVRFVEVEAWECVYHFFDSLGNYKKETEFEVQDSMGEVIYDNEVIFNGARNESLGGNDEADEEITTYLPEEVSESLESNMTLDEARKIYGDLILLGVPPEKMEFNFS